MFDHPEFRKYEFDDLPLNRDVFLMDERWMADWGAEWIKAFNDEDGSPYEVGSISWAQIEKVVDDKAEVLWAANMTTRFHGISVELPRTAFILCVEAWGYEKRPTIFVKSEWNDHLHARCHSTFAMIDASDFSSALASGAISAASLGKLRDRIDELALNAPNVSFTSFADSLLLKTNWTVGSWDKPSREHYNPEDFILLIQQIDEAYRDILGVSTYAVVTQGTNEFYGNELVHRSTLGNHVSLNSLGLPFAQLSAIESTARAAIKGAIHPRAELYLDEGFFLSLHIDDYQWRSQRDAYEYDAKLSRATKRYVCLKRADLLGHLEGRQQP